MKCKVNESLNSGMGRPRTSLISAVHSSSRSTKGSSKNEGSTVRRSSRRATIERRVWAVPKKSNKFTTPSAKKKDIKESKKDRKPSSCGKMEARNISKVKSTPGTKRISSPTEDLGPSRKKVKKKDEEKPGSKSNINSSPKDKSIEKQGKQFLYSADKAVLHHSESSCLVTGSEVDVKDGILDVKVKRLTVNKDEKTCNENESKFEKCENFTESDNDSKCDIGKEETMCIDDDLSLHKAVIVEVVSDYNRSEIESFNGTECLKDSECDKIPSHTVPISNSDATKLIDKEEETNGNRELTVSMSSDVCCAEGNNLKSLVVQDRESFIGDVPEELDSVEVMESQIGLVGKCKMPNSKENVPTAVPPSNSFVDPLCSSTTTDDISVQEPGYNSTLDLETLEDVSDLKDTNTEAVKESSLYSTSDSSLKLDEDDIDHDSVSVVSEEEKLEISDREEAGSSRIGFQNVGKGTYMNGDALHSGADTDVLLVASENRSDCSMENDTSEADLEIVEPRMKTDRNCNKQSGGDLVKTKLNRKKTNPGRNISEKSVRLHEVRKKSYKNRGESSNTKYKRSSSESTEHTQLSVEALVTEKCETSSESSSTIDQMETSKTCQDISTSKVEGPCIPEIESNFKTLGCVKQKLCSLNEGSALPLHIDLDDDDGSDDEGDHVSLSVALAQLVDSECSDEAGGAETLTIHSAAAVSQINEEKKGIVTLECNFKNQLNNDLENEEDAEDEEGKLLIKEDDDASKNEQDTDVGMDADDDMEGEEEDSDESEEQKENKIPGDQEPLDLEKKDLSSEINPEEKAEPEVDVQPLNLHKPKKQIPPLIKISSRPPAIKTPLKCPECPMQFCTVRSLFWHFGLHGARSRETCLPPILLQDLIVPWDKPSISLFLSQAQELLNKSVKSVTLETDKGSKTEKAPWGMDTVPSSYDPTAVPLLVTSSASTRVPTASVPASCENSSNSDSNEKVQASAAQFSKTKDHVRSNGDVILKIPIPRLKRKFQASNSVKPDKFVNILPKIPLQKRLISRSAQVSSQSNLIRPSSSANSPPPQVTLQPSTPVDLVTVSPQTSQIPTITVRSNNSQHQVQIQPLPAATSLTPSHAIVSSQPVTSTQSLLSSSPLVSAHTLSTSSSLGLHVPPIVTSTKPASASPSHITIIPVDNISSVNSSQGSKVNQAPVRMIAPSQVPSPKASIPGDGIVEKDGLVMINSNLALRIVSSIPSTLDTTTNTTNTTSIHPISNPSTNNITILPQLEGSRTSSLRETNKTPDILTIVPQVDLSKRLSLLKGNSPLPNTQMPSCSPATSSNVASGSQVVKLYLLHPKESSNQSMPKLSIPEAFKNINGLEVKHIEVLNGKEKDGGDDRDVDDDDPLKDDDDNDDEDEDEKSMVIADIKEEAEDDLMDPLSLCAVTMEDEHLEASNQTGAGNHSNASISASESDKESSPKMEVKLRGKKEKLDIVKYEARRYVCCFCNRRFGWSTDLKRHVILHTGERPFQCKVCPASFTRKFLLQNHMKRMHPDKCRMSDLWP